MNPAIGGEGIIDPGEPIGLGIFDNSIPIFISSQMTNNLDAIDGSVTIQIVPDLQFHPRNAPTLRLHRPWRLFR